MGDAKLRRPGCRDHHGCVSAFPSALPTSMYMHVYSHPSAARRHRVRILLVVTKALRSQRVGSSLISVYGCRRARFTSSPSSSPPRIGYLFGRVELQPSAHQPPPSHAGPLLESGNRGRAARRADPLTLTNLLVRAATPTPPANPQVPSRPRGSGPVVRLAGERNAQSLSSTPFPFHPPLLPFLPFPNFGPPARRDALSPPRTCVQSRQTNIQVTWRAEMDLFLLLLLPAT